MKVKSIIIERLEGPTHLCGKDKVTTIREAQRELYMNGLTAPAKGGGYDKHNVSVQYMDGLTTTFRVDVQKHQYYDLEKILEKVEDGA